MSSRTPSSPSSPVSDALRDALLDALAVVWPVQCAGCAGPDRAVCSACRIELRAVPTTMTLADGTPVHAALRYEGVVRRALIAVKDQGRTDAGRPLAHALRIACEVSIAGRQLPTMLLLMPASRPSTRARGYDPLRLLARAAGLRPTRGVLVAVRTTVGQKTLDVAARHRNRAGSMRARHPLVGHRVLLVDDVVTTGSTLLEAARAVREAGGTVLGAAVVAATPRRSGRVSAERGVGVAGK